MKTRVIPGLWVWLLVFSFLPDRGLAAMYNTQTYYGNGVAGAVGNGSLTMSNDTYTVQAKFNKGIGSFMQNMVIFIDCAPGGFTSTSPFSDRGSALETAISGVGPSKSSVANFASGFEADYAIAMGVDTGSSLYKLVQDSTGAHLQLVRSSLNFNPSGAPNNPEYFFQFDWADIGLPNAKTNFFKFETSYITSTGSRTLESFEGLTGTEGFNTITFTNYDTYGVKPIPENTNLGLAAFGAMAVSAALATRVRRCLGANRQAGDFETRCKDQAGNPDHPISAQ